ncbi:hypothetical protein GTO91_16720 [Heliobacterium undosum]|uniref:Uncharacterized protein n=1 Tax=Heliomicrobium undosum TaxID=121734 RepID=A0A845L8J1_9FIRM|nr:hypothetical protein [Heliomicrobium undosum]MZP31345.1 hypothetical protein [Heliomicrobium undosum]
MDYADGGTCLYKRTFLVIEANQTTGSVKLLNVSSIADKVHKLLMPSNRRLTSYRPPFLRPSFVKLDALYQVEYFGNLDNAILHNGDTLDLTELTNVHNTFASYQASNHVTSVCYTSSDVAV